MDSNSQQGSAKHSQAGSESVDLYDDTTSDHSIETEEEAQPSERAVNDTDFEDKAVSCFRYFILFVLVAAMAASGAATWHFMTEDQNEDFENEFDLITEAIAQESNDNVMGVVGDCKTLASTLTALAAHSATMWPYFYEPNFSVLGSNFRDASSAMNVGILPLVTLEEKTTWESFALEHQEWIERGLALEGVNVDIGSIPAQIYTKGDKGQPRLDVGAGPYAPMWEMSATPTDPSVVNYDTLSDETYGRVFETVQGEGAPVLSDLVDPANFFGPTAATNEPTSLLVYPIQARFVSSNFNRLVATLAGSFSWQSFFTMSFQDVLPVILVVDDNCGTNFTFQVNGNSTTFEGYGDLHNPEYNQYGKTYDFAPSLQTDHADGLDCSWTMRMYPSTDFYDEFNDQRPAVITTVVVSIFLVMSIMFGLYDCAVHSRQRRILAIAAQSERILSILYPKTIRDRLFGNHEETSTTNKDDTKNGNEDSNSKADSKKRRKKSMDPVKSAKYQLKTFMNEDAAEIGKHHIDKSNRAEPFDEKPIADLFPHTTVMFADIAGFTAWSSVREPSQVFTLLETVYHAFDQTAKRRKVFKVETVGDCYVAVTGLPEPRKDHALAMARFARECVQKFGDLVSQLEVTLGPDTGDLAIRVGLHSGPVTAGVLRGDKSRFQLFGDTVNTAARIESTGKRNHIHVSMETAELLQLANKGHWVKRREQEVEAKGKGKLQTYWLLLKDDVNGGGGSTGDLSASEMQALDESCNNQAATPVPQELARKANLQATSADDVELPDKIGRLVKWNVDVLLRLLKQIVAKRNAAGNRRNYDMMLTQTEQDIRKKFMVLDEVVEIIALPEFNQRIYKRQEDPNLIELPREVVEQMRLYVTMIALMYRDNNFHNFEHASHVMMSVSKLLSRIVAPDVDGIDAANAASNMHDHTYGINSDPMTQFSVVLAALIHDVDHLGVSNFQLIKEEHKLAQLFKNKSVAEQNSIVLAWDTLMDPRFYDLRRTIYADPFELERFRQLLANTVLATDIFDKQLQTLRKNRWDVAFSARPADALSSKDDINRKATIVIEHLIQASDVAHTMQHWHIYRKWNERLFAEMTVAFQTGRMDKNPAEFWYQGELGFFDNYIIPLAKKLKDCGVFGVSSDEYLNYALENRREWANKGEDVLKSLMEQYQPTPKEEPKPAEEPPKPIRSPSPLPSQKAKVPPLPHQLRRRSLR